MNINVICIGKLKEKYWTDAVAEYSKRLSRFCKLNIIELKESPLRANPSAADEEAVMAAEGKEILGKIGSGDYVITLEIKGKGLSSEQLADRLADLALQGKSTIDFVIGGSLGLSPEVSKRVNYKLSFSAMTFPHQMMRVILLEQIYRAFKINNNETYHK
ncbi:MAG: 23S rRNA (pseudouridine(1915)-N(3))-methyltransferase RlmH [Firmicutes bacterium]|nr:23S rRNA (pseudouridine(1915)-N(3))-methyltransferase RlmH [Bacillota bacterium]